MSVDKKIQSIEPEEVKLTVEGLGPWSYSKLKLAQNCPLGFYLKYVLKLKVPEAPLAPVTIIGKAAHAIIENVILGKGIQNSFTLVRGEYVDKKKDLTPEQWKESVETLEFNITAFRERLDTFETKYGVKGYVQELKSGLTRDYNPTGFFSNDVFWRGIIDMGIKLNSGDLVILDHKTGAPAMMGLRNFSSQLDSYKVLFHHGVEGIEGAQAGIHFIKDGKVMLDDYSPRKTIETVLVDRLEFYLKGAVDGIIEMGKFAKIKGSYCKYCDYAADCKSGALNTAETRSSKYFPIKQIT